MQDEAGGTDCGVLGCRDEGLCGTCQAAETALGEYLGTASNWFVLESVEGESVCWETQSASTSSSDGMWKEREQACKKEGIHRQGSESSPKNNKNVFVNQSKQMFESIILIFLSFSLITNDSYREWY